MLGGRHCSIKGITAAQLRYRRGDDGAGSGQLTATVHPRATHSVRPWQCILDIFLYFYIFRIMDNIQAVDIFAALAQTTRLEIFRLLVRAGGNGLPAGTIASELGVPTTTLSFHLKELKSAGIVLCDRQGRSLIYRPDFSIMGEMVNFLTAHCCAGLDNPGCQNED